MWRYVVKRLLWMIPIILGVTILIFTIMYVVPGDPARVILGMNATGEQLAAEREALGLNRPYLVQLGDYMQRAFLHFDFGNSYINGRSVTHEILERLPYTIILAAGAAVLMIVIGIPLGLTAAVNQYTWKDNLASFLALIFTSVPGFWLASLLSILFCVKLKWLPATGVDSWKSFILPIVSNCMAGVTIMTRQTRSAMLEVIRSDYVVTAKAKGQEERKVIWHHAFRNALIPLITVAGNYFGLLLGGAMVIEIVFGIPGLGNYLLNNITTRDYPCVEGAVIVAAIMFSLVMLLTDILYAFVDPRIKAQFAGKKVKKINA